MSTDPVPLRPRRAILTAALGAAAASVTGLLGRPAASRAANGDVVTVGGSFLGSNTTWISNNTNNNAAIRGWSSAAGVGVDGYSYQNYGVNGYGELGVGVFGGSNSGTGLWGRTNSATAPAIKGVGDFGAAGVFGYSGIGTAPAAVSQVGLYGYADKDGTSCGVRGDSPTGVGVLGLSTVAAAVYGHSTGSTGIHGQSDTSVGLYGSSGTTMAVWGDSSSGSDAAVLGRSVGDATGVYGYSGSTPPAPPARTGVYGRATHDSTSRGVHGYSTGGRGVYGQATSGQGVRGYATTGTGVYASVANLLTGTALRAVGRVRFDNCAGVATFVEAQSSTLVTPGIDLSSSSAVVATLLGSAGGATVERVAIDATANSFTIHLTAATTATVKVAWHVFG
jgi:hypothetical protein